MHAPGPWAAIPGGSPFPAVSSCPGEGCCPLWKAGCGIEAGRASFLLSLPHTPAAPHLLFKALGHADNASPPHGGAGPGPPCSLARLCLQDHRQRGSAAAGKRHHAAKIPGNCPLLETARHGQEDGETSSHLISLFSSFFNFWMQLKAATQPAPPHAC